MTTSYPFIPGAQDRDTSIAAADAIEAAAPTLRDLSLAAIRASGTGLTADEAAATLGLSILSIRPRVTELGRLGEIEDTGVRRNNDSGKKAIVWRRKWKTDFFS